MDAALKARLIKIGKQIEKLQPLEKQYLFLEAHRKVMFSGLYLSAPGKNVAEKEAHAYTAQAWANFVDGLAEIEATYLKEKRYLDLQFKALDCEYLQAKTEAQAIRRGVE